MRDQLLDSIHAALLIAEYDERAAYLMQLDDDLYTTLHIDERNDIEHEIEGLSEELDAIGGKINMLGFSYDIMSGKWIK
jgi:hypothetical protein